MRELGILFLLAEQREVDAAIRAVLDKARNGREVVVLAVLEDKQATRRQHVLGKYKLGDGGQIGQSVWRIGKDKVELLLARLDEAEHIATYKDVVLDTYLRHTLAYKGGVVAVHLHANYWLATARQQLERYAAGSGEEVESACALHIYVAIDDVKYIFFGKVGCRTCLERAWNVEVASLVYTCYYSHT